MKKTIQIKKNKKNENIDRKTNIKSKKMIIIIIKLLKLKMIKLKKKIIKKMV